MVNSAFVPHDRPDISLIDAIELAGPFYDPTIKVWLLGRRGYYRDSMGAPGANDRNIYDDAIALVTPDRVYTWNANCDPSKTYPGMAVLTPGLWWYKLGIHGLTRAKSEQYRALVQAAPVTVDRDGSGSFDAHTETGWFGINIHRGGKFTSTGSAGCQTIYEPQYDEFLETVEAEMAARKMDKIAYILTERANG